jgi:hypothetical protein
MIKPDLESTGFVKESDTTRDQVLSRALDEYDVISGQRNRRIELLKEMEGRGGADRKVGYLSFFCSSSAAIESDDIPPFGDVLLSIGDVDELNLIINSPGGDGTVAEKIIELCRAYCKRFRVIVPNRAKSAATVIALGSDQIVMGYCSELGPIDAQVPIVMGGVLHYISAQSFIDARTSLEKRYKDAVKNKEDAKAILQQIAVLDNPFIDHCEKLMEFSREVARKYLEMYMFSGKKPAASQKAAIENVLKRLSSVDIFKVHGRMIDGNEARTDLKLDVELLGKDDPLWKLLWDYYVRADLTMTKVKAAKLVESRNEMLILQGA